MIWFSNLQQTADFIIRKCRASCLSLGSSLIIHSRSLASWRAQKASALRCLHSSQRILEMNGNESPLKCYPWGCDGLCSVFVAQSLVLGSPHNKMDCINGNYYKLACPTCLVSTRFELQKGSCIFPVPVLDENSVNPICS